MSRVRISSPAPTFRAAGAKSCRCCRDEARAQTRKAGEQSAHTLRASGALRAPGRSRCRELPRRSWGADPKGRRASGPYASREWRAARAGTNALARVAATKLGRRPEGQESIRPTRFARVARCARRDERAVASCRDEARAQTQRAGEHPAHTLRASGALRAPGRTRWHGRTKRGGCAACVGNRVRWRVLVRRAVGLVPSSAAGLFA